MIEELGLDSRQGQGIFLFYVQSGSGAHPQWTPWAVFPGMKCQGREADILSPCSTTVKNSAAIPHPPICLHSVVHNKLRTGTTLPLDEI